ncbi:DNA methyltransferase [Micromonospora sp. WMMD956]|uniref:DNA methyltransferase n=1 Tax=Micromonospora sp. WMMD956 TaxID=3016108 RepID=UPI002417A777|nr:DNA methyltransferase [Micromonospora sp. WMMD956]MDG4814687.1 DNA methyltransferase [Micromonospora sp. WMMD956]
MTDPVLTEDFKRWIGNRKILSFGSNDGAAPLAFQTWHRFKEAFPPELLAHAFERSGLDIKRCLDPFGGSGTTGLACQMLGIESTTVEINPFFVDVIGAKLHRYNLDNLVDRLAEVRRRARSTTVDYETYFAHVPRTFIQPGMGERWLYNRDVAQRLANLLAAIEEVPEPDVSRLFRIIVGGFLTEVSNATISGKGRRYRRNWKQSPCNPDRVETEFARRTENAIRDIQSFSQRPEVTAKVIRSDARMVDLDESFEISVFSPPYPNSFDYTDVYNLELWMLGYLRGSDDNRSLRTSTISSHVQLSREYAEPPQGSITLDRALAQLDEAKDRLWNRWIPAMVGSYFSDLLAVLSRVHTNLTSKGQCWIVVGDSSYAGVSVPVAKILSELLPTRGWSTKQNSAFRQMRSSVQQGWRPDLAESLLVLERTI